MRTNLRVNAIVSLCLSLQLAPVVMAADGRLEINQACVVEGCFAGDNPGFPVEITSPGSYVLTGNLEQAAENGDGISVQANEVVLDLNGFTMFGGGGTTSFAVIVGGDRITVKNGSIVNFFGGVYLSGDNGNQSQALDLTITDTGYGVRLGNYSEVRNCLVETSGRGIVAFNHAKIMDNRVTSTSASTIHNGIETDVIAVIRGNTVNDAGGRGIHVDGGSIVADNIVGGSGLSGIYAVGGRSILVGNTVFLSQNYGFEFAGAVHHLIRGNAASNNNQSAGAFTDYDTCATCTLIDNHVP